MYEQYTAVIHLSVVIITKQNNNEKQQYTANNLGRIFIAKA